jgi:hypothetical protein
MSGCGTKTGLSANVAYSGFDNARTVSISPHMNAGNAGPGTIGPGLGAQWNASHPDSVVLIVALFNQYTGITGAELNIDGEKISLAGSSNPTDMSLHYGSRISTQAFATDIATVKKIIASKRTWLRVHTPTGYIEDAVIDGATDSKAYHALIRFIAAVEAK